MITIEFVILIILLFLSAFFSGSETALFSLSPAQIEKMSNKKKGKHIRNILERPRQLLITILIGNEFVNVSISVISAGLIIQLIGQGSAWINICIVLPILLLFGEIFPKTLAIKNNESFSEFIIMPLQLFGKIITPIRWVIKAISDKIVNLFIKEKSRMNNILTEDVVKTIVEEGEKDGVLDSNEKEIIYRIFDFADIPITDIMTPRANIFYLKSDIHLKEMIKQIKKGHFSSVPVFNKNRDDIIGILFATDLIGLSEDEINDSAATLEKILRKPYFVPSTKRADELFRSFQKKKISLSIVLDEFGGVVGLVTIEDLLEIIFGEIADEYEVENRQYEKHGINKFKVEASMSLLDFNNLFKSELTLDGVDTIGGFVFAILGELPEEKKSISYNKFDFIVDKIINNRIESLIIRKRK